MDVQQRATVPIGVEIGEAATQLTIMLDASANARRWHSRFTIPLEPDAAIAELVTLIESALDTIDRPHAPLALCLAAPAELDAHTGVIRELRPLPAWRDFPLSQRLLAHLRARQHDAAITLVTTTAAAAIAEARGQAGQGLHAPLYLHLGRTVTAAFLREGALVLGAQGREGMLAHWRIGATDAGPRCSCGEYGHLEPIASAQAVIRTMIGRASHSEESSAAMLRISQGRAEAMSVAQVVRLAAEAEPIAQTVIAEQQAVLASALANCVRLLDPDGVIIGGPFAEAGPAWLTPLRQQLEAQLRPTRSAPDLRYAALGPAAPLLGAYALAHPPSAFSSSRRDADVWHSQPEINVP